MAEKGTIRWERWQDSSFLPPISPLPSFFFPIPLYSDEGDEEQKLKSPNWAGGCTGSRRTREFAEETGMDQWAGKNNRFRDGKSEGGFGGADDEYRY